MSGRWKPLYGVPLGRGRPPILDPQRTKAFMTPISKEKN